MPRAHLERYVMGMAGLALVRGWLRGDREGADARVADIRRLLGELGGGGTELDIPELDARAGYAGWASSYDATPNPLIDLEEPVVHGWIDERPAGAALDAACGTGRHGAHLARRGHRVVGVDLSPEMLAAARARSPGIDFREGTLTALPLEAASVDLVVCALALAHLPDLGSGIAELGRVVRAGGRVIISDLHPTMLLLGGGAFFQGRDGSFALVRSHARGVSDYLMAAGAAGLVLRRCVERPWRAEHVPLLAGPLLPLAPDAFRAALVGVPGALMLELERA